VECYGCDDNPPMVLAGTWTCIGVSSMKHRQLRPCSIPRLMVVVLTYSDPSGADQCWTEQRPHAHGEPVIA
jgi:hypothetical protein